MKTGSIGYKLKQTLRKILVEKSFHGYLALQLSVDPDNTDVIRRQRGTVS